MKNTPARICGNKHRYPSRGAALHEMWRLIRRGTHPSGINVYKCPVCGGWHVGHKARKRKP